MPGGRSRFSPRDTQQSVLSTTKAIVSKDQCPGWQAILDWGRVAGTDLEGQWEEGQKLNGVAVRAQLRGKYTRDSLVIASEH